MKKINRNIHFLFRPLQSPKASLVIPNCACDKMQYKLVYETTIKIGDTQLNTHKNNVFG